MDFVELQQDWAAGNLYPWLRELFGPKSEVERDRFGERLRVMSEWTPWMERCEGHDFSYACRLFGYRHAQPVDEAGAVQRVYDLRRCSPDWGRRPLLQSVPQGWLCPIKGVSAQPKQLLIDRQTGAMSLVPG